MDTVGKRLRAAREAQGYTVQQLHELSGINDEEISGFEEDRWFPPVSALIKLQGPLKCSIEWLLIGVSPTINPLYSPSGPDEIMLSRIEFDLISRFRGLNERDRQCAFDIITMLYEQGTGNQTSAYSTYAGNADH